MEDNIQNDTPVVETQERRHDEWKSAEIDKLAIALAKVQAKLEGAKKESKNPFFNSSYADLHTVIKSSFPTLSEHGLSVSQGNEIIPNAIFISKINTPIINKTTVCMVIIKSLLINCPIRKCPGFIGAACNRFNTPWLL